MDKPLIIQCHRMFSDDEIERYRQEIKEKMADGVVILSPGFEVAKIGVNIPDNATNGDAMKAIFPNLFVDYDWCEIAYSVSFDMIRFHNFNKDWWDAPYKENI